MSASNDYCSIQAKLCFHRLLLAPCCRILPNGLHHCHQWVTSRSTFKNNIMVIIKTTINNHFTIILVFVLVSRSHQPKHLAGDHGGPLALGDFSSNLPPTPHPCRILLLLVCIFNQNMYNIKIIVNVSIIKPGLIVLKGRHSGVLGSAPATMWNPVAAQVFIIIIIVINLKMILILISHIEGPGSWMTLMNRFVFTFFATLVLPLSLSDMCHPCPCTFTFWNVSPLSFHFHFLICVTIVFDQELELEKLPFSVKGGDDDGWERCDLIFIHVIIKDWIIHPLLERFIVIANSPFIKRPFSLQLQPRSWSLSRMLCNLHRQLQDKREARWSKRNFHLCTIVQSCVFHQWEVKRGLAEEIISLFRVTAWNKGVGRAEVFNWSYNF